MKSWNFNYIRFLEECGTIKVRDTTDFKIFKQILKHLGISFSEFEAKERNKLSYWQHLAEINAQFRGEQPYFSGPLYFSFNNGKGIMFDWNSKRVRDYFETEIYTPQQISEELGLAS